MAAATAAKPKTMWEALLNVQIEAQSLSLPKSGFNPHHKNHYTPLDVVLGAVVPLLNKHQFVLIQNPTTLAERPALTTAFLYVPNGERIESTAFVCPDKENPQGQGAGLTYLKRYMVMSILGLTSDEDNDGNPAHTSSGAAAQPASTNGATQASHGAAISDESPI